MENYLLFALVILAGQFTPGPDFLLILKISLNNGKRAGALAALGISLGLLIHCTIVLSGLAWLLEENSNLSKTIKLLGSIYLLFIAYNLIKDTLKTNSHKIEDSISNTENLSARKAFTQGFLTNLLNPKVVIFLGAVLAGFVNPDKGLNEKILLSAIIVIQGGLFWFLFACSLQMKGIKQLFIKHQGFFNTVFAILLIVLVISSAVKN